MGIGYRLQDAARMAAAGELEIVVRPDGFAVRSRKRRSYPAHLVTFDEVECAGTNVLAHAVHRVLKDLR